jgi:hypothetical protein
MDDYHSYAGIAAHPWRWPMHVLAVGCSAACAVQFVILRGMQMPMNFSCTIQKREYKIRVTIYRYLFILQSIGKDSDIDRAAPFLFERVDPASCG